MARTVAAIAIALAYLWFRFHGGPVAPSLPLVAPVREVADVARQMDSGDRKAMADAYMLMSRAVAADPDNDPVFPDVAALRRAHRAVLLCVWRGLLDNKPGSVPGLREAVEGAFDQRIGSDDVLLNPDLKQSAAKTLADIAASFQ